MDKKEMENFGYYFAKGIFKCCAIVLLITFTSLIFYGYLRGIDNSDIDRLNRSGLKIHTDQLTGVQYLSVVGGGVTPRLDGDGQLMFERRLNE
ncbi:hypothetical protein KAR91_52870 [Candidatus Pacearchaeota archaeon]|nr:hypothetical protein [Candidatus Pacearchaeota archaeon]